MSVDKKIIDYNSSFSTTGYDKNNTWRQRIISKIEIIDKIGQLSETAFLNQACLAESVYGSGRMLVGDYTWQAIISDDYVNAVRIGCKRRPENSIIDKKNLSAIDIYEEKRLYSAVTDAELIQSMNEGESADIICEVYYKIPEGKVKIYFPANYINYCAKTKRYQVDVGPVLFLDDTSNYASMQQIQVSYCAFSNINQHVEFNTLEASFVSEGGRYKRIKKTINHLMGQTKIRRCMSLFYTKGNRVKADVTLWKKLS